MTVFSETEAIHYATTSCGICGARFALEAGIDKSLRDTGRTWHCPICGIDLSYGEGRNALLARELAVVQRQRDEAKAQRDTARDERDRNEIDHANQVRAMKGATTKLKRRIGAGCCPCCKRTFSQLSRHMTAKHPDYAEATP